MIACARGYARVVEVLLKRGADVEVKGSRGATPLAAAAGFGMKEIVELLLAHGADPTATDDFGFTPVQHAEKRRHFGLAGTLKKAAQERRE